MKRFATFSTKLKVLILGFVLAAVIAVLIIGLGLAKQRRSDAVRYRQVQVIRGDLDITILSIGTVQPRNRLEIKPPIPGRIETVLVNEGQTVIKGELLAWMSSTERAALLDAARSKGEGEFKRWEQFYKATPVIAPIAGTIISRNVEAGQSFTAQDAVFVMSDHLTIKAQVDETDIAQIKLKQAAEITLDAYSTQPFMGTVDQLAYDAKTVNNVTTYIVDVLPGEIPSFMRSGMTASVLFQVAHKSAVLLVPANAIRTADGRSTVLRLDKQRGKPAETKIHVGISDGKSTEILSGLEEGTIICVPTLALTESKPQQSNPFAPAPKGRRR